LLSSALRATQFVFGQDFLQNRAKKNNTPLITQSARRQGDIRVFVNFQRRMICKNLFEVGLGSGRISLSQAPALFEA
jgi:hypothetical protein